MVAPRVGGVAAVSRRLRDVPHVSVLAPRPSGRETARLAEETRRLPSVVRGTVPPPAATVEVSERASVVGPP